MVAYCRTFLLSSLHPGYSTRLRRFEKIWIRNEITITSSVSFKISMLNSIWNDFTMLAGSVTFITRLLSSAFPLLSIIPLFLRYHPSARIQNIMPCMLNKLVKSITYSFYYKLTLLYLSKSPLVNLLCVRDRALSYSRRFSVLFSALMKMHTICGKILPPLSFGGTMIPIYTSAKRR